MPHPTVRRRDVNLTEIFFHDDAQLCVDDSDPRWLVWHLWHSPAASPPLVKHLFDLLPDRAQFEGVTVNDLDDTVDHIWASARP